MGCCSTNTLIGFYRVYTFLDIPIIRTFCNNRSFSNRSGAREQNISHFKIGTIIAQRQSCIIDPVCFISGNNISITNLSDCNIIIGGIISIQSKELARI